MVREKKENMKKIYKYSAIGVEFHSPGQEYRPKEIYAWECLTRVVSPVMLKIRSNNLLYSSDPFALLKQSYWSVLQLRVGWYLQTVKRGEK
jgi:hypothetical protein